MTVSQEALEGAAQAALSSLYPFAAELLNRYVDILANCAISWGLLGPREGDKLWSRHVANSLAVVDAIAQGLTVADVGSGAGLPGIPLALVRPDLRLILIEPLQRRSEFLAKAVTELGISDRVTVIRARAEEYSASESEPKTFEIVTCRAVAPLAKLIGWTKQLFLPDGKLVALKGQSAEEEIAKAQRVLRKANLSAEVLELSTAPGLAGTRAIQVQRIRG